MLPVPRLLVDGKKEYVFLKKAYTPLLDAFVAENDNEKIHFCWQMDQGIQDYIKVFSTLQRAVVRVTDVNSGGNELRHLTGLRALHNCLGDRLVILDSGYQELITGRRYETNNITFHLAQPQEEAHLTELNLLMNDWPPIHLQLALCLEEEMEWTEEAWPRLVPNLFAKTEALALTNKSIKLIERFPTWIPKFESLAKLEISNSGTPATVTVLPPQLQFLRVDADSALRFALEHPFERKLRVSIAGTPIQVTEHLSQLIPTTPGLNQLGIRVHIYEPFDDIGEKLGQIIKSLPLEGAMLMISCNNGTQLGRDIATPFLRHLQSTPISQLSLAFNANADFFDEALLEDLQTLCTNRVMNSLQIAFEMTTEMRSKLLELFYTLGTQLYHVSLDDVDQEFEYLIPYLTWRIKMEETEPNHGLRDLSFPSWPNFGVADSERLSSILQESLTFERLRTGNKSVALPFLENNRKRNQTLEGLASPTSSIPSDFMACFGVD